jgi:hypothetical protein
MSKRYRVELSKAQISAIKWAAEMAAHYHAMFVGEDATNAGLPIEHRRKILRIRKQLLEARDTARMLSRTATPVSGTPAEPKPRKRRRDSLEEQMRMHFDKLDNPRRL